MFRVRDHIGKAIVAFVVAFSLWYVVTTRAVHHGPGVLASDEPVQLDLAPSPPFQFKNHSIEPLATFDIRARVLSRERYWFDRPSKVSPIDFALGWGSMSDNRLLDKVDVSQAHRWWLWSYSEGATREEISFHAANMHMIPSTPAIERTLLGVRVGQVVHLIGKLVEVRGNDGFVWRSSLTRTDTGDGSCEIVFVEDASVSDG